MTDALVPDDVDEALIPFNRRCRAGRMSGIGRRRSTNCSFFPEDAMERLFNSPLRTFMVKSSKRVGSCVDDIILAREKDFLLAPLDDDGVGMWWKLWVSSKAEA